MQTVDNELVNPLKLQTFKEFEQVTIKKAILNSKPYIYLKLMSLMLIVGYLP